MTMTKTTRTGEIRIGQLPAPGRDDGWHYDDAVAAAKLAASLRRFGQLRPVVVRRRPGGGELIVVDGRRILAAMRELGWQTCLIIDIGEADDETAARVALGLCVGFGTDFAAMARSVSALVAAGHSPESLASACPFDAERIRYMDTLTRFDWSAFAEPAGGQSEIDWRAVEQQAEPETGEPLAVPQCACDAGSEVSLPEASPPEAPLSASALKRKAAPQLSLWD